MTELNTPVNKEEYYDTHIAPRLLEIANECKDRGLSFVAGVEFGTEEFGRTVQITEECGIGLRLVDQALRAYGNVDSLWLGIQEHAKKFGHNSIFLQQQGIPTKPTNEER